MPVTAFDAKDFLRSKFIQEDGEFQKATAFYSPLGVGVHIPEELDFKERFVAKTAELAQDFELPYRKYVYSSTELKEVLGPRRATPFCDKLIQSVADCISRVFVTYVVRPPATYPLTEVGGFKCPRRQVRTELFLRQLGPSFSYMTAWAYCGIPRPTSVFHVDGIGASKRTSAWDDLSPKSPKLFPHGDECNPYISCADMIAFLTDVKLYKSKTRLNPDGIKTAWTGYPLQIDVHYMDVGTESKYSWYTEELIDTENHLARPMIFLIFDELARNLPESVLGEEKFGDLIMTMQPYFDIATYAFLRGGGFQKFDSLLDMRKVKDDDTVVYLGPKSKIIAQTILDMREVEMISLRELRAKLKKETQH
jgi:hypothetical protein